ncbi:MAG TPA: RluA family pseudouridine synthase [Thermoanaerobaculia bacterium]|nr:RluA family pseudouridine synthase [Thermoanaerobaculia bacterium]
MSASPSSRRVFQVPPTDSGKRLDAVLTAQLAAFRRISRTTVQAWIEEGRIRVDGQPVTRPSARLGEGQEVEVTFPPPPPREPEPEAREVTLSILHEDDDLLALDKPPGVLVHPSAKRRSGTLYDALVEHVPSPHLVSRLDEDTSGVMLVAKSPEMHTALGKALRAAGAAKDYLAIAYGSSPHDKGRIDLKILRDPEDPRRRITSPTEGQDSTTLFEKLGEVDAAGVPLMLLRCRLVTGRTHQIRVHLRGRGWPLVGDPLYGLPHWRGIRDPETAAACRDFPRQALHAFRVAFAHPRTGAAVDLTAPVPADLAQLLAATGLDVSVSTALPLSLDRRSISDSP